MTNEELLKKVLLYVKEHQPCSFTRNPDLVPEQFKDVNRQSLDDCVFNALKNHLLEGKHLSNGFHFIRINPANE